MPPSSRKSIEPGPTSITFSGVAIRRPESSLQQAYEHLPSDPLDPTDDENSTVRVDSGELIPAPPSLRSQQIVPIEVPSIFHEGELRFALNGVLGKGGTSRVFAAFDHDLERELAIKVVPRQDTGTTDQLAREARITARLSHPNVPPIFDVGTVGEDFFLALPLIRGRSLRFRIRQALKDSESSALPYGELVQVLLKVSDALSYAHARGIIHKDIKPDNIMVGDYGEVMVVDWGSAAVSGEPPDPDVAVGTPAYMAPEQAMGRRLDLRADVFALGATLFHALLLRKPLRGGDLTETIQRRMAGEFDAPTPDELVGRPRALVAVAQRAMSFNPSERYQNVGEFADALRAYQAGGDSWSEPILDETFQDENWHTHWHPDSGESFARRHLREEDWTRRSVPPSIRAGQRSNAPSKPRGDYVEWCLETVRDSEAFVVYPEVFQPRLAIDFEGTMLRGFPAGELTIVWTDDDIITQDNECRLPHPGHRTFSFRVGAMANHVAGIFSELRLPLSTRAYRLHQGRASRIRVEIDGDHLRLFVDGESIAEHQLEEPLGPGRFGFLAMHAGKRFARVRVRQRGTPGTVSALAIGDAFYARGAYREALEEYERVGLDPANTSAFSELLYKRGLCAYELGQTQAAENLWNGLDGTEWKVRVAMHEAEASFRAGDHERAISLLQGAAELGRSERHRIRETWAYLVRASLARDDAMLDGYLNLRDRLFPDDPSTRSLTARTLLAMGEFERVLEEFPEERLETSEAYLALGRTGEVHGDVDADVIKRDRALLLEGEFDSISNLPISVATRLILEGKGKEAMEVSDEAMSALAAGENEQALLALRPRLRERITALVRVGRTSEALNTEHPLAYLAAGKSSMAKKHARSAEMELRVSHYRAIEAFLNDDREVFAREEERASELPFSYVWDDVWFDRYFLIPLCKEKWGEEGAFSASLEGVLASLQRAFSGRAYYMAALLLDKLGDKEFLAQPAKGSAAGRLYLARALRAELVGQSQEAAQAYAVYNSLKPHHRFVDSVLLNPSVDLFCQKRLNVLR